MDLVSPEDFKSALRCWASGVTILTSRAGDQIHGMTVSAFSSVSASPPLVLVCANQGSTTHDVIRAGDLFCVNLLASDQEELSARFASGDGATRFEGVAFSEEPDGAPCLDGALAHLECRVRSAYPEGTHTIFVGEVMRSHAREDGKPLVYFDGSYRDVGPAR